MVDFIRSGVLELWGSRVERELQNVKFLPLLGFESGTFRIQSERATTELRRLMYGVWFTVCRVLPECLIFRYISVARGRCSKITCPELHFENLLQSANFLIGKTAKQNKYYMTKIGDKLFSYIFHVLQVNF